MRFKIDENLPGEIADDLRQMGHDADTVTDESLTGSDDPTVIAKAFADKRSLITLDKGIGDLRRLVLAEGVSVVVMRPRSTGRGAVLAFARRHLPSLLSKLPLNRLVIVSDHGIRIR